MDAKPQRPLRAFISHQSIGNENSTAATHAHHQRQKSAGNPKAMTLTTGMKAAAKRTAMGDVSNVYHVNVAVDTGAKPRVLDVVSQNHPKEAVVPQGAFHAPAQRRKSVSVNSHVANSQHDSVAVPKVAPLQSMPLGGLYGSLAAKQNSSKQGPAIYCDNTNDENQKPRRSNPAQFDAAVVDFAIQPSADRKSPRHYKSQPTLKPEQPLLRRTKSRILPTVAEPHVTEDLIDLRVDDGMAPYVDAVEQFELVDAKSYSVDEPQDLLEEEAPTEVASEEEVKSQSADAVSTSLGGPEDIEEYWDEDEDFYDDQAYTTAHSYRSMGDDTGGGVTTISYRSLGDDTAGGVTTRIIPKITTKAQNEVEAAKIVVKAQLTPFEIEEEQWDMTMVAEYGDEIFEYMRELESRMTPNPHYMDTQAELQWSMRSVMIEWVVQVHGRFGLLPETLFLAVNYIDRFLSSKVVSVGKLQLVGATAILIAAKYEEINCPSVSEMVYMVDSGYTTEEILKAERFMLTLLNFELGWPGPMSFLRRISKADDYDLETRTLAKYFLEVTIMDERFVGSPPSFLAAGAHALSRWLLRRAEWSTAHVYYSGYTWAQLKPVAQVIWDCCQSPRVHHPSIFEKYADRRFKKASIFVEEEVSKGELPSFLLHALPGLPQPASIRQLLDDSFYSGPSSQSSSPHQLQDLGMLIPIEG